MTFSNLRKFDVSGFTFSPAGLIAFRDAAKAKFASGGTQARLEDLAALAPGKP